MYLAEQWRRYAGPVDERAESECNRIYRRCFIILAAGALISIYYSEMLDQAAMVNQLPNQAEAVASAFPSELILLASLIASCLYGTIAMARKGISTEHPRFETDEFPVGFYATLSALIGMLIALLVSGLRMVAELQLVGASQVTWAGDIAMGIVVGLFGFGAGMLLFWLIFRSAKKNGRRLSEE